MSDVSSIIKAYVDRVKATDRFKDEDLKPILLGLYGEVGSIMSTAKKFHREKQAFLGYREAVIEEYGDAFWYLTALCRRLRIDIEKSMSSKLSLGLDKRPKYSDLDTTLLRLGEDCASLLSISPDLDWSIGAIDRFVETYVCSLALANINLDEIIQYNLSKVEGRFLDQEMSTLPRFDDAFEAEERIPDRFEIAITQRKSGKSYLQWNGVFIGDPLTDNITDQDGYRFHDVFHFSHAAILHWSPTFRALIKHKRKSNPKIDEAQDSGRAIVVEEGLTAWIFSRAKQLDFFKGQKSVSFDLLKTIQQSVRGYEVDQCPLKLWERAILQGYEVFEHVYTNRGGIIIGDRNARTISYKPLKDN